jgi:outer membrane protein insertion porin family
MTTFAFRTWVGIGLCLIAACCAQAQSVTIMKVTVTNMGPVAVDQTMARLYIGATEGRELEQREVANVVANDVRDLRASGHFADVRTDVARVRGGVELTYWLRMKSKLVKPVTVVGASEFSENKIRDLLNLQEGDFVDGPLVAGRIVKVKEAYREKLYGSVSIEHQLDPVDTNAGLVALTVRIVEGSKSSIGDIRFPGAENVEYSALREAMNLPAWWNPFRWFLPASCDMEDLRAGCERIKALYKDRGYLDVVVKPPKVEEPKPGKFVVTVEIEEHDCYHVARVCITNVHLASGMPLFPEADLLKAADLKTGTAASSGAISKAAEAIRDYYESRGYMNTGVRPLWDSKGKDAEVDVRFMVAEGRLTYIRNVLIRGNSTTRDKVIRRELLIYPGEKFDGVRIRKSEARLRNLNYFDSVTSHDEGGSVSNESDVVFEVKEGRTAQIMAGVGFSSVDKLSGFVEVSQANFDIRGWPFIGGGEKIRLRTEFGSTHESYLLSFVEPWFLDRKLSLSTDLYITRWNEKDYKVERKGGALGLGVPLGGPNKLELKYRLEEVNISDVKDTNAYVVVVNDETNDFSFVEPSRLDSSLALTWSRDTRDSFLVPTRGGRSYATGKLMGGPLGCDTDLYNLELGGSLYVPLWWQHVLSFRVKGEVVDAYGDTEEVPLSERLFIGGGRSVRGYRNRWVGPKAERADGSGSIRPSGGQSLALANAEYSVPVPSTKILRLVGFYDIGNVWYDSYEFDLSSMASSAGIGLRIDFSYLPIRFDYAWPLDKDDPRSREENWSFWIGSTF